MYLLLRGRRLYRDYTKRIDEMTLGDPLSVSSEYLARLLAFVKRHNEYYSHLLSHGDGIESLPILTKDVIRQRFEDLQSFPKGPDPYINSSGGSTGRPVTLIQDANYASWSNATQGYYFREFLGVEMNTVKNVWLWGSERDSLRLTRRPIRSRVASLRSFKQDVPEYIRCGSITWMARVHRVNSASIVRTMWPVTRDPSTRSLRFGLPAVTMFGCTDLLSSIRPLSCSVNSCGPRLKSSSTPRSMTTMVLEKWGQLLESASVAKSMCLQ